MIKRILITVVALLVPLMSFANGAYVPGRVTISTMYDGGKSLSAAYNVRYNPAASSNESVSMRFYRGANSVIAISAGDANAQPFVCYITPTNYLWEVAQEGMRAAGNGAILTATIPAGSTTCNSFVFHKTSASQD